MACTPRSGKVDFHRPPPLVFWWNIPLFLVELLEQQWFLKWNMWNGSGIFHFIPLDSIWRSHQLLNWRRPPILARA
jgi:hypothetical protein